MKKILIILAVICAVACSNDTNTIYQFSAVGFGGEIEDGSLAAGAGDGAKGGQDGQYLLHGCEVTQK